MTSPLRPEQLQPLLAGKRWFAGGDRAIRQIDIRATLDLGPAQATGDLSARLVLVVFRVVFVDTDSHLYHVPVLVLDDGTILDAATRPEALSHILTKGGWKRETPDGVWEFHTPDPAHGFLGDGVPKALGADQSNTSVRIGDALLKLYRRVHIGRSPEGELGLALTEGGFGASPKVLGTLQLTFGDGEEMSSVDLAIVHQWVAGAEDGFQLLVEHLEKHLRGLEPTPFLDPLVALARDIASMHAVLAHRTDAPFAPEPLGPEGVTKLATRVRQANSAQPPHEQAEAVDRWITETVAPIVSEGDFGMRTRIHGDLHFGQILHGDAGWAIVDFEGEPTRSIEERRRKDSPLRDVAGVLRSLGYAIMTAEQRIGGPSTLVPKSVEGASEENDTLSLGRVNEQTRIWERRARQAFLKSYRATLAKSSTPSPIPTADAPFAGLLRLYEMEKALYELRYEQTFRPQWVPIPLRGIERLLKGASP
ncbi:MAG: hypothetical protein KC416_04070 [Myxococcales bacterium]|nr:hypothetical protein [Myxococcales bacterium]